jgi:IclR family acetate operon transcriptional repressor
MDIPLSRSAVRPFDILEAFRVAGRPLSLSEMARMASIPLSTCHSVVRALEQRGLLYFLSPREAYPTRRLWDMAREITSNDPIATRFSPILGALRDATNETVILGTRQDDKVLYLLVVESSQTIRYSSATGDFKPLHSSSIGKALLASMSSEERTSFLATHTLPRVTEHTITNPKDLIADLEASRTNGCFITRGENVADVMAIALPFRLGSMSLGMAVAGPLGRMEQNSKAISEHLLACIKNLEQRNGDLSSARGAQASADEKDQRKTE